MSDRYLILKDGAVGRVRRAVQMLTATGVLNNEKYDTFFLSHATVAINATLGTPKDGDEILIYNSSASGTAGHNVTLPAGYTWDGTNDTVTINAPGEFVWGIFYGTRFYVLASNGAAYS